MPVSKKVKNEVIEQLQSENNYNILSIKNEETVIFEDYPVVLQGIKDVELRPKVEGSLVNSFSAQALKGMLPIKNDPDLQHLVQ